MGFIRGQTSDVFSSPSSKLLEEFQTIPFDILYHSIILLHSSKGWYDPSHAPEIPNSRQHLSDSVKDDYLHFHLWKKLRYNKDFLLFLEYKSEQGFLIFIESTPSSSSLDFFPSRSPPIQMNKSFDGFFVHKKHEKSRHKRTFDKQNNMSRTTDHILDRKRNKHFNFEELNKTKARPSSVPSGVSSSSLWHPQHIVWLWSVLLRFQIACKTCRRRRPPAHKNQIPFSFS